MKYRAVFGVVALALPAVAFSAKGNRLAHDVAATTAAASPVDELLAADRAFSAASAKTNTLAGLTAMFSDSVMMPVPGTLWAEGLAKVTEALRGNPDNSTSRTEWVPIRGGVSADGQHGFTFGYMTIHKADNTTASAKYMAYWVKGAQGWRVAAYKRGRRPDSAVVATMMPPAEPPKMIAASRDASTIAAHAASLKQAEQAFSDEAQRIGLGAAFAKNGSSDAVNMGPGASYVVGADAISRGMGGPEAGPASPVSWNADKVLVASSGDLGVTFGVIHPNANPTAPGNPFFTIWRRASPKDAWRYVAE